MAFPVSKLFDNIQKGGSDLLMKPTPGNYIATLDTVSVGTSKSSGRLQVAWFFIVSADSPLHASETIPVFHGIHDKDGQEDERGIGNLGRFVDKLELPKPSTPEEVDSPEKLQVYLKTGVGRTVRLIAKKGNEPDSVFVNLDKLISMGNGQAPSDSFPTGGSPTPSKGPTFAVGNIVTSEGVVYEVKSLLDATKLVGLNKTNGSVSILENKNCSLVANQATPEVVTPAPTPDDGPNQVELKIGMKISADCKGVAVSGTILKLDEDQGQIILQSGTDFYVVTPNDVTGIFPEDKQEDTSGDLLA